jgi:phosphoglucomutase/phosphomannomutase
MPGSEGMTRMRQLMQNLRQSPPKTLGGLRVVRVRDYLSGQEMTPGGQSKPFAGPPGDMVILDLEEEGNFVAVRPSGTEPKAKFYLFAYRPAELLANLDDTKKELAARLRTIGQELFGLTGGK